MKETLEKIVKLVKEAQNLALTIDIDNIVQPGIIREIIMAEILGHKIVSTKRDEDACNIDDPNIRYEYLTCYEGKGTGQFHGMFKSPPEKRENSLNRITRNSKIYIGFFYEGKPLIPKVIYEIEPSVMKEEALAKMERSKKQEQVHLSFSEKWARENGAVVYLDK